MNLIKLVWIPYNIQQQQQQKEIPISAEQTTSTS